jgi:hypothetical protein
VTASALAEPIAVTLDAVTAFAKLGIRYAVGGSMASSFHGWPRSTDDVDLVASISLAQAAPLVALWTPAYYADANMIREAIRERSSFNIIHTATVTKIDVFVPGRDTFAQEELRRASPKAVGAGGESLVVATAEDIVLQKLRWYRLGGEQSERQWRDVIGVLVVGGPRIDLGHLRLWVPELGVVDLLERVLAETAPARGG